MTIDPEDLDELRALIVGFLQQSLKDRPSWPIHEFNKKFPEVVEEPEDWFKRFKTNSSIDALRLIPETAVLSTRGGVTHISLNKQAGDPHLVELITNQKTAPKKKKGRPVNRAQSFFNINRRFPNQYSSNSYQQQAPRLNRHQNQHRPSANDYPRQDQRSKAPSNFFSRSTPNIDSCSWVSEEDPRQVNNFKSSRPSVPHNVKPSQVVSQRPSSRLPPPQVQSRVSPPRTPPPPPKKASPPSFSRTPTRTRVSPPPLPPARTQSRDSSDSQKPPFDPTELNIKKDHLRQRIQFLLDQHPNGIKLIYLSVVYSKEFEEKLVPGDYGYPGIVSLLEDPVIAKWINVDFNQAPHVLVTSKWKSEINGKQEKSIKVERLDSIDLFNLKNLMIND